tara:strand:+ start:183 stop:401 length:219 start_codon:yes stop_codon:yes gene_type:complete
MKRCNFVVKARPNSKKSVQEENSILIKKFMSKWKKSGLLKEIKNRQFPMTRGQKARQKKNIGARRHKHRQSS